MKSLETDTLPPPRIGLTLIGYGNTLRRDDGVGPAIVERLEHACWNCSGVRFMALHQLLPEVAADLETHRVIFIDASVELPAGVVAVRRVRPRVGRASITHHVDAVRVLALAEAMHGWAPRAMSIAVGVADLSAGEKLSTEVQHAADKLVVRLHRMILRLVPQHA